MKFFKDVKNNLPLLALATPCIAWLIAFCYIPMFGIVIAFKDFRFNKGIFGSSWVGFKNFEFLFTTDDAWIMT
ncbi:MAG: sugar ABC transporter permease, partial [Clostridia bacterium]|nr:sugar ABC transporter permease [Clostridia bacterium]